MSNIKWFTLMLALGSGALTVAQAGTTAADHKGNNMYQINITLDDAVITARLDDTPTVRDFIGRLPMTVKLEDYAATEKVTYLPRKLTTEGAPAGVDPAIGDIAYYAPWGNIAIYYKDFGYSPGLIKLGEITSGMAHLKFSGAKQATIELIQTN
jgi:hypothetical protein